MEINKLGLGKVSIVTRDRVLISNCNREIK
jgi:tRNA A37 threonylcarbamoyladenosine dehydratase